MSHTGTAKLKQNLLDQLERLLQQKADLDESKDELDDDEYEEMLSDTMEQLKDFSEQLEKMISGDMTLVSELGAMRMALQATVSDAFKTTAVIKLFAKREPGQLRNRLAALQRDQKLGKLSGDAYQQQAVEILAALKKLGEKLTTQEQAYLSSHMTASLQQFEHDGSIASTSKQGVSNIAAAHIKKAQN
mmetsp:Transcript_5464/g.5949  ORF Transcript_5464/g.5949 Transcript_5464/m.5949 type:complete len:189 (-) Transcript_5464:32-598(-)|eukprot:CAMPEP_0168524984 /NCGR_PEP_ID=MMETSP0405-20121227/11013_1 /TAXON_ID=498012 /ORGANISM="Trichosphaerium sp, Strain Am-I-7 wt" /LENGTH=188 /DNA_ID=CAMNT_0008547371 /DNA_START=128 /DNA_END=694 /DNA_ORIENTATION=-